MPEKIADPTIARQVELAIRRLDSLSTLPCVAARLLSQLLQTQTLPASLAETIESDPTLVARIFSACHQQGLSLPDEKPSLRRALDKLGPHIVRDSLFSVRVFQLFDQYAAGSALPREQLIQHSLAAACCAKAIAEVMPEQIDSQLAYLAGLLHDIGKFALDEAMPKSFARIVEEAKSENCSACSVEQKHLGLDHTTLGKRAAQKWHLPDQITLAIWLHHSDTVAISQNMRGARIAQVVQLADSVARQCGIGQSGSYDPPGSTEQIAQSLEITLEQLEQIRQDLPESVGQKSKALGLNLPDPAATYCDTVRTAAAQFAQDNTKLSLENRRLQTASTHLDFLTEFLLSIDPDTAATDIAENFAVRWQKFYQTGMVCLYLLPQAGSQTLEAVIVETLARTKTVYLNTPADSAPIPKALANTFAILDAHDHIGWLFDQLDVDFDLNQTKLVPLLSCGRAIAAIAFELRYPSDTELFQENFKMAASIGGSVLDMALASRGQQHFAEQFAQLLAKLKDTQRRPVVQARPEVPEDTSLVALAEMAAGAAHELNNPLSVISGRAQLLAGAETDREKKRILKQIQENTDELSAIIKDLMSFAKPPSPKPAQTDIRQMLNEAVQLTSQKTNVEHINVQIKVDDGLKNVFVDSAQVVSAIANVICNSLESYADKTGPIKITADAGAAGNLVKLQINDLGCGMDAETVKKATRPFFSGQPAGRKRGMGLAHAQRLIELNKGSLDIKCQPGTGTTVTITLPCD
jgi:putative nucleotidyltransferase with HDIG domain